MSETIKPENEYRARQTNEGLANIIITVHDNGVVVHDVDGGEVVFKFSAHTEMELLSFLDHILWAVGYGSIWNVEVKKIT